jgi:hypothetical protein
LQLTQNRDREYLHSLIRAENWQKIPGHLLLRQHLQAFQRIWKRPELS